MTVGKIFASLRRSERHRALPRQELFGPVAERLVHGVNLLGKEVRELVNETQTSGAQQKIINVADLPAGIYFVNVRSANASSIQKISVVH